MASGLLFFFIFVVLCQCDGISSDTPIDKANFPTIVVVGAYDIDVTNAQGFSSPYQKWENLPGMPKNNNVKGVQSACWDNVVYIGTSYTTDQEFYAFNLNSNSWTTKAFPNKLLSTPSATQLGGQIYFAGGQANDGVHSFGYVQSYNPSDDTWSSIGDLNTARNAAGMAALGGALYICGGYSEGSTALASCETYSFSTNKWSMSAPMRETRTAFNMVSYGGAVYAMGGTSGGVECEKYDPTTNSWSPLPNMPTFRSYAGTFTLNGEVCVAGGLIEDKSEVLESVDCLDVASNVWSSKQPNMKFPQWWFAIAQC